LISLDSVQGNALYPGAQITAVRLHDDFVWLIARQQMLRCRPSAQIGAVYGRVETGMGVLSGKDYGGLGKYIKM